MCCMRLQQLKHSDVELATSSQAVWWLEELALDSQISSLTEQRQYAEKMLTLQASSRAQEAQ